MAASAITAVYAAGYVHTQAADASLSSTTTAAAAPTVVSAPAAAQPPGVTTTNPARTAARSPANAAPTPTAASRSGTTSGPTLKDGAYTGVGTSRRGDIQVSLDVQGGRVVSVNISGATTQYPTRLIANLPSEVVARQSAQLDVVTGATYSSLAFRGAVQQALQKAQA